MKNTSFLFPFWVETKSVTTSDTSIDNHQSQRVFDPYLLKRVMECCCLWHLAIEVWKEGNFILMQCRKILYTFHFCEKNLIGIISFEKFLRLETCLWLTHYHPLFLKKIGFFASCSSPWNSTIDPTVTTFFDWSLFEIRGCSGRNISYYKYVKGNFSKDSIMIDLLNA